MNATTLADLDLTLGTATAADVQRAYRLADDGGTIQAHDMRELTRDPRARTTTSLRNALIMLGCATLAKEGAL